MHRKQLRWIVPIERPVRKRIPSCSQDLIFMLGLLGQPVRVHAVLHQGHLTGRPVTQNLQCRACRLNLVRHNGP